jgi:ABC-2 type transport system permease protein
LVVLGAAAFLALGYALAAFLRTEEQASGVVQLVQIPMMFLSGIFFQFEFLPSFLQSIGRLMPLTYLADALRQEMVSGTQVAPLAMDVAILGGWLIVCLGITARFFRWS